MYFKKDFSEYEPWSGAVSTWEKIVDNDKVEEFEQVLEDIYCGDIPTDTQINDLLWFDWEWVLETLDISDDNEESEE